MYYLEITGLGWRPILLLLEDISNCHSSPLASYHIGSVSMDPSFLLKWAQVTGYLLPNFYLPILAVDPPTHLSQSPGFDSE